MRQINNYRRFYAVFNKLETGGDREAAKETLVQSFTDGRTTSLREMSVNEYNALCASLEERTGWRDMLKKSRSSCLKLMQQLGIDTTNWSRVDAFCLDVRIAGKRFSRLGVEDLEQLSVKLRSIKRKGGLKATAAEPPSTGQCLPGATMVVPLSGAGEC